MARVPGIYESGGVNESAIPVPQQQQNQSIETFGGGQATEKLNNSAVGFVEKIKQDADQVAVQDALNQYSNYETKRLYDPKEGALFKKGKDAFPVKETTLSSLNEDASGIEDKLSNNAQKMAFRKHSQERMADAGRTLDRHVGSEMSQFDEETTKSFLDNNYNTAIANFQDMNQVEKAIQGSQAATIDFANRNGKGQDWITEHTLGASSKISLGVVKEMVERDMASGAKEFFDHNKEHFNGPDLIEADKLLKIGTTKAEALKRSDELFARFPSSQSSAYAALQDIKEPAVRIATRDQLKERFTEQDQAKAHDDNALYLNLYNKLSHGAKVTDTDFMVQMERLTPERQKALKDVADGANKTDPEYNYKLVQLSSHPETYKKFQQIDFNDPINRIKLSNEDLKKWQDRQGKTFDDDQMKGLRTIKETVENIYGEAGLQVPDPRYSTGKPGGDDFIRYNKFLDEIENQVKRTGDNSPDNKAKIARDLVKDEIINKRHLPFGLLDVKQKRFQISPADVDLTDIEPAVINKLKTNLRLGGLDPDNEENLREAYAEAAKAGLL